MLFFGSVTIDGSLAGKRGMNQSVQARSLERNEKEGKQVKFDEREVLVDSEETSNLATTYKTEEQVVKVC